MAEFNLLSFCYDESRDKCGYLIDQRIDIGEYCEVIVTNPRRMEGDTSDFESPIRWFTSARIELNGDADTVTFRLLGTRRQSGDFRVTARRQPDTGEITLQSDINKDEPSEEERRE